MTEDIRRCPACNMPIESKPGDNNRFCSNCGKPIQVEQTQTDTPDPAVLLEKACVFMQQGDFSEAEPFIEEALTIAPQYADAYIVKLLCKLHLCNINQLATIDMPLASFEEFSLAIRYGSASQVKRYNSLLESNAKIAKGRELPNYTEKSQKIIALHKQSEEIREQLAETERFLAKNQDVKPIPKWRKVLRIVEQVFMIVSASFWTLCTLAAFPLIILDAPFVLRLIFIFRRNRREKLLPEKIEKAKRALHINNVLLQEMTKELDALTKIS